MNSIFVKQQSLKHSFPNFVTDSGIVYEFMGVDGIGFPFIIENKLSLTYGAVGSSVTEEIGISSEKLLWTETEE